MAVRTTCTIVRAAQSIDYADPSVAQREYRVGGEIPSLPKVIKTLFFTESYGMVLIEQACSSFRSTLTCTA